MTPSTSNSKTCSQNGLTLWTMKTVLRLGEIAAFSIQFLMNLLLVQFWQLLFLPHFDSLLTLKKNTFQVESGSTLPSLHRAAPANHVPQRSDADVNAVNYTAHSGSSCAHENTVRFLRDAAGIDLTGRVRCKVSKPREQFQHSWSVACLVKMLSAGCDRWIWINSWLITCKT